jgi:hypothetical protein
MIEGIVPGSDHFEARARLEDAGWQWLAHGDWSQVYRSPDGERVARVAPFDPAYSLHVRICLENSGFDYFQSVHERCALAPAGELVVMECLEEADSGRSAELCGALGEVAFLERAATDRELLGWAQRRQGDPALSRAFELLHAGAREGARTLGFFGGLDVRPGNVMQDTSGQLKLIDPYFVAGPRLIPAILSDVEAVGKHYRSTELRGFLEIAVFEKERDEPGPVLRQLREQVARLEARERSK